VRIGLSGWRYREWRGIFYPEGLVQRTELAYVAEHFPSVELNGSFYSLQRPSSYERWYRETPEDFVFAVKGGRFITHMKKLRGVEIPLANFFASGVLALGDKLGPILWQFPANVPFDSRFREFFRMLPRTLRQAARVARGHDARLLGRAYTRVRADAPLRHAVEVRSPTAACAELVELLREEDIALVVADTAGHFPYFEDVTSSFVYVRLHGDTELYTSGYSRNALARWAKRIRAWHAGNEPDDAVRVADPLPERHQMRDVYVYFDNDAKVHAPFDALALARRLGLSNLTRRHPDPEGKLPVPRSRRPSVNPFAPRPRT
jgi:uncharacterized protein YecE (DUF72 family)